jgi:hypothetical protein
MAVKGAADMLADARAAVRNSASRRVIGPVICFEDEIAGAPKGYDASGTPASRHGLRVSGRARKLAYEAQDKWLHLFGRNLEAEFEINGLALLVSTSCAMAMELHRGGGAAANSCFASMIAGASIAAARPGAAFCSRPSQPTCRRALELKRQMRGRRRGEGAGEEGR